VECSTTLTRLKGGLKVGHCVGHVPSKFLVNLNNRFPFERVTCMRNTDEADFQSHTCLSTPSAFQSSFFSFSLLFRCLSRTDANDRNAIDLFSQFCAAP